MFNLNIFMRKDGTIFQNKEKHQVDKAILSISNHSERVGGIRNTCAAIAYPRILTGNQWGHVYILDLQTNRFNCLHKIGNCCTAIAFANALYPDRDVLVAASNCYFYVIQSLNGKVVAKLLGHDTAISHISVDKKGYVAVTSSIRKTVVWNLQKLTKMHEIILPFNVDLIKSMLIPPFESILSIFKKSKICSWDHKTQRYNQFCDLDFIDRDNYLVITTADISSDGKLLIVGGKASWLLYWDVDVIFQEPGSVLSLSNEITSAVRIAFINISWTKESSTYMVLVLSSTGAMYLYDVINNTMITKITITNDKIISVHCSSTSAKVVAVTLSGLVKVYDMENLFPAKLPQCNVPVSYEATEKPTNIELSVVEQQLKKQKGRKLSILIMERLKGILKEYGSFPAKYRLIIWSNFLDLTDNCDAFKAVYKKGVHVAFKDLEKSVPVLSQTLFRALQLILSMCGHWCPQLVEIEFLPSLLFPFVKLLHQNLHLCFEIIVAFMCKWANNWFINYPYPNAFIIIVCENILKEHDSDLLLHLIRHGISAEIYVWTLLKTMFSEVFMKSQWIQLLDHVIANPPEFLLFLVVSFSIASKKALLKCNSMESFEGAYTMAAQEHILSVTLKTAYQIYHMTPYSIKEKAKAAINVDHAVSYGKYGYPIIINFPTMVIDIKAEKKQSLEELNYIKSRQELLLNQMKEKSDDKTNKEYSTKPNALESGHGKMEDLDIAKRVMATRAKIANVQIHKYRDH